jgi:hypothetical protein
MTWAAFLVFYTIVTVFMHKRTRGCGPSYETLAEASGVGYSTCRAAIEALVDLGYLIKRRRYIRNPDRYSRIREIPISNHYIVVVPEEWRTYFRRIAVLQRTTLQRYLNGRLLRFRINKSIARNNRMWEVVKHRQRRSSQARLRRDNAARKRRHQEQQQEARRAMWEQWRSPPPDSPTDKPEDSPMAEDPPAGQPVDVDLPDPAPEPQRPPKPEPDRYPLDPPDAVAALGWREADLWQSHAQIYAATSSPISKARLDALRRQAATHQEDSS